MKFLVLLVFFISILGCSVEKNAVTSLSENNLSDSTKYELIVAEPGFDTWLLSNLTAEWHHSDEFYKQWNKLYASEWNYRYSQPKYSGPYDYPVDYDPTIEYGKEIEHKLYWFFKFMEEKYDMELHIASR